MFLDWRKLKSLKTTTVDILNWKIILLILCMCTLNLLNVSQVQNPALRNFKHTLIYPHLGLPCHSKVGQNNLS